MVKLTHSLTKKGQNSYPDDSGGSNTSSGTYVDFLKQRERLVSLLEKETKEEQVDAEKTCKESSLAILENLDKAIEHAQMHFHSAAPNTSLDFSKIRTEFEVVLTNLGQQMRLRERDMNHKTAKTAAIELEHHFTKRSEDLRNWQQNLNSNQYREIEKHLKHASREDRIDTIVNFAREILEIPFAGFEENLTLGKGM